jgi:hypothetical protein
LDALAEAQALLASLPDVAEADRLIGQGKYAAAVSVLERAAMICDNIPMVLARVSLKLRLAQAHQYAGHVGKEQTERRAIYALAQSDAGVSTELRVRFASALVVSLLRLNDPAAYEEAKGVLSSEAGAPLVLRELPRVLTEGSASTLGDIAPAEHAADVALLLGGRLPAGDARQALLARALEGFTALRAELPSDRAALEGEIACRLAVGTWDEANTALSLTEGLLGKKHPLVGECLRVAAGAAHTDGQAVIAEGIFRSSISRLEATIAPNATDGYGQTYLTQCMLADAYADFAYLMCHLEWNGKVRCREAAQLLESSTAKLTTHARSSARCFSLRAATDGAPVTVDDETFDSEAELMAAALARAKEHDAKLLLHVLRANDKPTLPWWLSSQYGV